MSRSQLDYIASYPNAGTGKTPSAIIALRPPPGGGPGGPPGRVGETGFRNQPPPLPHPHL